MNNKFILLCILALSACTPNYEDLREWTTTTRKEAKSHVIPFEAPVVNPPKAYIPPIASGLNAFSSRRLNNNVTQNNNTPNFNRPKETLEAYGLENLRYVGSLRSDKGISGFIEADNHTYTVHIGNYIGQNYGKIQKINENEIILSELVEDSYGNWIYRHAKLPLSSSSENDNATSQPSKSNTPPTKSESEQ